MDQDINHPESFSTDNEQDILIEEYAKIIDHSTNLIISAFNLNQLNVAFEAAAKLVSVLCTSLLTPKNYYTVYVAVTSSLSIISNNIKDDQRFSNEMVAQLYEIAQYHSICMQRLYLMLTVAPELCSRQIVRTADLLDDLSDMTRAAQDPIRALFLRHYFLNLFEDKLPDSTTEEAEQSANYLLNNFAQMNRMWVRIEDLMASDERKNQRSEFSSLIGKNIQCIANLKNITSKSYTSIIFPFLIKHVELCEDALAQDFILKSIIKYFPSNFHLETIDNIFGVFSKIEQGVNVLDIVNLLLETIQDSTFIEDHEKGSSFVFVTIAKNIEELFTAEGHLSLESKFSTLTNMLKFSLHINHNNFKNIKNLLKFTEFHIDLAISDSPIEQLETSALLMDLLDVPLDFIDDAKLLFTLDYLPALIQRMKPEHKLYIADKISHLFIDSETKITNEKELLFYIKCTGSIIIESHGTSAFFSILQLIQGETIDETISLLRKFYESFETMKIIAKQRFIQPFSMRFINILYNTKQIESTKNETKKYLLEFLENNEKISPYNVIKIYLELFKMSIRESNLEMRQLTLKKISKLILNIREETHLILLCFSLLQTISFYFNSLNCLTNETQENDETIQQNEDKKKIFNDDYLEIRGFIEQLIDKIHNQPIIKIKLLCNILIINTQINGYKSIEKHLQNIYGIIQQNSNENEDFIKDKILSLYSFLDLILYFIEKNENELLNVCESILKQVLQDISSLHKIIFDSNKKLEDIITQESKNYYLHLEKYIQSKNFLKD